MEKFLALMILRIMIIFLSSVVMSALAIIFGTVKLVKIIRKEE